MAKFSKQGLRIHQGVSRRSSAKIYMRSLRCERLEDRHLLAVVTVDTIDDVVDFSDGVTSLREAIFATNLVPGADEIRFDFGQDRPTTILLAEGELEITDSLTITGAGAAQLTIDAQHQSRIFSFTAAAEDLTIAGLTLRNGRTLGFFQEYGDTTLNGGGIRFLSSGTLTVSNSTLSGNSTIGFNAFGGGIFSDAGAVKLFGSTVTGNYTAGGIGDGGGVATLSGPVTLTGSTVSGNYTLGTGSPGGGIRTGTGDVTLHESALSDNQTREGGGSGGGIWSDEGDVALINSVLLRNSTLGDHALGGGIHANYGAVTLTNSILAGNFTTGMHARGGGVESLDLTLINSTLSDNYTTGERSYGGGVNGSRVTLIDSTLADNKTSGLQAHGGGMFAGGGVEIVRSTVSGNRTQGDQSSGGGIFARGYAVTLSNSTFSGNGTTGYFSRGGGIFSTSGVSLYDSTLTGNTTAGEHSDGGGIYVIRRSGYRSDATLTIKRSIVAGNSVAEGNDGPEFVPDFDDGVLTIEYSLIGDNAGTGLTEAFFFNPDGNGNMIGGPILGSIDPRLGPLADNGGPTETHALLAASPAIGASDPNAVVGVDGVPGFDQRGLGFGRIVGRLDMGAYEFLAFSGETFVVDTLVDEVDGDLSTGNLSLREAISVANQQPDPGTIRFDPRLAGGTILLTEGELGVRDDLTILGLGHDQLTIDASGSDPTPNEPLGDGSRIFEIDDQDQDTTIDVFISGLTLTGGDPEFSGGAIRSQEVLSLAGMYVTGNHASQVEQNGGGVWASGRRSKTSIADSTFVDNHASWGGGGISARELTITDSHFMQNSASRGGAISGGSVIITDSEVVENTGRFGGGMLIGGLSVITNTTVADNSGGAGGGVYSSGEVSFVGSRVTDNTGTVLGGGVFSLGSLTVTDSIVAGNSLNNTGEGGGIFALGNLAVVRSEISGNTAGLSGGGISGGVPAGLEELTATIESSTIANNSAIYGGGVWGRGSTTISNSTLSGNSARTGGGIGADGEVTIVASTVTDNSASFYAGGVGASGLTVVTNSTVSGNSAGVHGGGIWFQEIGDGEVHQLSHSTVAGNRADVANRGGGRGAGLFVDGSPLLVDHSIVVGNRFEGGTTDDIDGTYDVRFSLVGEGEAFLAELDDNGGPTLTHALLPGSPAINFGDPNEIAGDNGIAEFDQRGNPYRRIFGSRIDIGAYEFQPIPGDFDGDGASDVDDLTHWTVGYGLNRSGSDFLSWQRTFGDGVARGVASSGSTKSITGGTEPTELREVVSASTEAIDFVHSNYVLGSNLTQKYISRVVARRNAWSEQTSHSAHAAPLASVIDQPGERVTPPMLLDTAIAWKLASQTNKAADSQVAAASVEAVFAEHEDVLELLPTRTVIVELFTFITANASADNRAHDAPFLDDELLELVFS